MWMFKQELDDPKHGTQTTFSAKEQLTRIIKDIKHVTAGCAAVNEYACLYGDGEYTSASASVYNKINGWKYGFGVPVAQAFGQKSNGAGVYAFKTHSLIDELDLMIWAYAFEKLTTGAGAAPDESACLAAATALALKTRLASTCEQKEYAPDMPPHLKSYVCSGMMHVALAMHRIARMEIRAGQKDVIGIELMDEFLIDSITLGLEIDRALLYFRNPRGADHVDGIIIDRLRALGGQAKIYARVSRACIQYLSAENSVADEIALFDAIAAAHSPFLTHVRKYVENTCASTAMSRAAHKANALLAPIWWKSPAAVVTEDKHEPVAQEIEKAQKSMDALHKVCAQKTLMDLLK
jgi:hypothetical protein